MKNHLTNRKLTLWLTSAVSLGIQCCPAPAQDGTYTQTFTVTATQGGPFSISARVEPSAAAMDNTTCQFNDQMTPQGGHHHDHPNPPTAMNPPINSGALGSPVSNQPAGNLANDLNDFKNDLIKAQVDEEVKNATAKAVEQLLQAQQDLKNQADVIRIQKAFDQIRQSITGPVTPKEQQLDYLKQILNAVKAQQSNHDDQIRAAIDSIPTPPSDPTPPDQEINDAFKRGDYERMADLAAGANKGNLRHEASDLETAMDMAIQKIKSSSSSQAEKDKAKDFLRGMSNRFRRSVGSAEDDATQSRLTRDSQICDDWTR